MDAAVGSGKVAEAAPVPPPPSDRAAKRTSSLAVKQLGALMALEEDSSCDSSDEAEGEHAAS